MRFSVLRSVLLLLTLSAVGCDSTGDDLAVGGDYHATSFTITQDGTPTDVLAAGGSLDLELDPPDGGVGTFRGRLVAPDLDGSGGFTEPFSGTYAVDDRGQEGRAPGLDALVTFETTADVFVRDATWELRGDRLSTTYPDDEGDDGIAVTLERD